MPVAVVASCTFRSVLNEDGEVEMDAVLMDGSSMRAGGVAAVQNIRNPVNLARLVMEQTSHVLLVGAGANRFAERCGIPRCVVSGFERTTCVCCELCVCVWMRSVFLQAAVAVLGRGVCGCGVAW